MKQFLRSGFLMIATCVVTDVGLHAQGVIYSTDFSDAQGWTFSSNYPSVVWAVDATPASVLGSPSWHSAPYSLNYNNGVNYGGTPTHNEGTATSPPIDLSVTSGSRTLRLWCSADTETGQHCDWDTRQLLILDNTNQSVLLSVCFGGWFGPGKCTGASGEWHFHSVPLDAQWSSIRLRFFFDTIDNSNNGYAGWFIDDLEVIADCLVDAPYCTPKLNSQGCAPTIFTTGMASLSGAGQAFRIWAGGVLNQKVGLMLWSRTPASTPFGGGTLCVAAPITRTAAQNSGGTSQPAQDCTGTYVLQFTPAMMSQAGLVVGDDVYSQYWSRDNGFPPPDNVGLTGGVHWEVCQ